MRDRQSLGVGISLTSAAVLSRVRLSWQLVPTRRRKHAKPSENLSNQRVPPPRLCHTSTQPKNEHIDVITLLLNRWRYIDRK